VHLAETSGPRGEVLGESRNRPPVDLAEAGNDAVGGDVDLVDPKHRPAVLHEHICFPESVRVEQQVKPFAGGKFSPLLLRGDCRRSAHLLNLMNSFLQFFKLFGYGAQLFLSNGDCHIPTSLILKSFRSSCLC
jgi:hypothetical protein